MPKRPDAIRHIETPDLQGEDSWVEIRRAKGRDLKKIIPMGARLRADDTPDLEKYEFSEQRLRDLIVAWNWVGDDGKPLPLPRDQADITEELTEDELLFLIEQITGKSEEETGN